MEKSPKTSENENPSIHTSPESNTSDVDDPSTPKAISTSQTKGYPTTFIEADTNSFKQVVQMLTGSPETARLASKPIGAPAKIGPRKQGFKQGLKNLKIIPGLALNALLSPSQSQIVSPSVLNLHKLVLRPGKPMTSELFEKCSPPGDLSTLEEKSIAEKGLYPHNNSPVTTPGGPEPRLLPLFPVTSPGASRAS
ncbi:hypothetical protein NMG60_11002985 [Bertholletia excelsa]